MDWIAFEVAPALVIVAMVVAAVREKKSKVLRVIYAVIGLLTLVGWVYFNIILYMFYRMDL